MTSLYQAKIFNIDYGGYEDTNSYTAQSNKMQQAIDFALEKTTQKTGLYPISFKYSIYKFNIITGNWDLLCVLKRPKSKKPRQGSSAFLDLRSP